MANVDIQPIPDAYRRHAERFWPSRRPIFDGPPTDEDRLLALELWRELDPASKRWHCGFYWRDVREFCGLPLTEADIASMASDL